METAVIVKVAVSAAPYSIDKPYDYLVPEPWLEAALPGARVTVPFGRGNRTSEGLILARGEGEKIPGLKPLTAVLDPEPVLDADGIALALWLRGRYFCTVFEAARTLLPAGLWFRLREIWQLTEPVSEEGLSPAARAVLEALRAAGGRAEQAALEAACGSGAGTVLRALEKEGAVVHETDARRKAGDRMRFMAGLAADAGEALDQLAHRRAPVRRAVVELLSASGPIPAADVCYFTGAAMSTLRAMERAGLVTLTAEEELRVPTGTAAPEPPAVLTAEQAAAYAAIRALADTGRPEAVLLQGVTGSGKTQVYLHLVADALARGRTALVLVPEIVLTPQMMRRFSARFGDTVAMIHSALRVTERYDQWKRIRRGEVKVVLGTRSAVFAPLKNLGLVILDEEQESGYQSENAPRYHARDVAKYLCGRDKAVLVLGSATPSVETAWAAEQGVYHRVELTERYNRRPLPEVVIADLRQEIRNGNSGSIGAVLRRELAENLDRGEQSILFLNRRGSSRMLLCGECGEVPQCPRCSVPLTYHSANGRLMCHHCGHSERAPERCPVCGGLLKHVGSGTQKVEEELRQLFPGTEVLRLDADTAASGHEPILRRFREDRVPILLGTQMVAKGLDFPGVTLVGVLAADLSLYVDNYRAAERTFSLLTQVVGRAGRGGSRGRAVIQTYAPENDVIRCAARQDYQSFYQGEIRMRRLRRCPPFADLFTFTVSGPEEGAVLRAAARVRQALDGLCAAPDMADTEALGPAPAPVVKLNNRYRYHCLLVGRNDAAARAHIRALLRDFAADRANRGIHLFVECNSME
ncbi:replication restart helicase PriA [Dysosmobacter sp.]|uniref:replication restart helicase PriA n=1 Tax=Dysosmobacter sp. TaxID=2591382 RepID=UPI002A972B3E|nr:primosomal protein N' [Dysosmobacter sp.]MCI6055649.1 primosomal protein N' [Dysosmobacter sp.]MDY5509747.1 primosomal protein N' [Dysosmobacter sp.]